MILKAHEKYNICKEIMLELIFNCPPKSINNKKTVVLYKKKKNSSHFRYEDTSLLQNFYLSFL